MNKKRVLSGIRASHSSLHIGNLVGAIDGMIALQENPMYETYYMVADLHGITTKFDPQELHKYRIEVVKDYLASGIDPKKSVLFLQSDVEEHAELAYLLGSMSLVNELLRMPSKKNEHRKYGDEGELEGTSFALLGYPVLMAADILLYKAVKVPIGVDQLPHLEFTQKVAKRLNSRYGLNFPIPEVFSEKSEPIKVPTVGKMKKGQEKMSKSVDGSAIFLNDSPDDVKKKVFGIPTDFGKGGKISKKNAIFAFIKIFMPEKYDRYVQQYKKDGVKYSEVKTELTEIINKRLSVIQSRRKYYDSNPEEVQKILDEGAIKARKVASRTLQEVRQAMGLVR